MSVRYSCNTAVKLRCPSLETDITGRGKTYVGVVYMQCASWSCIQIRIMLHSRDCFWEIFVETQACKPLIVILLDYTPAAMAASLPCQLMAAFSIKNSDARASSLTRQSTRISNRCVAPSKLTHADRNADAGNRLWYHGCEWLIRVCGVTLVCCLKIWWMNRLRWFSTI